MKEKKAEEALAFLQGQEPLSGRRPGGSAPTPAKRSATGGSGTRRSTSGGSKGPRPIRPTGPGSGSPSGWSRRARRSPSSAAGPRDSPLPILRALLGHEVTIFEAGPTLGGHPEALRTRIPPPQGHPGYGDRPRPRDGGEGQDQHADRQGDLLCGAARLL